jgi:hypothetical protein
MAEVAADFTIKPVSSDQDCLKTAPNDADGLVTSRRYRVYNSWYRKWGYYLDLVPVSSHYKENLYYCRVERNGTRDVVASIARRLGGIIENQNSDFVTVYSCTNSKAH